MELTICTIVEWCQDDPKDGPMPWNGVWPNRFMALDAIVADLVELLLEDDDTPNDPDTARQMVLEDLKVGEMDDNGEQRIGWELTEYIIKRQTIELGVAVTIEGWR